MNSKSFLSKVGHFFKKNVYYIVLFVCIAGIATMITLASINLGGSGDVDTPPIVNNDNDKDKDNDNDGDDLKPVDNDPILFISPIANYDLGMAFSPVYPVYNATLRDDRTHKGLDFKTEAGTNVLAVYGGTVESVETDIFQGTVVTVRHNDELVTVYKSLASNVRVQKGDRVAKGDVLGQVSASMGLELLEGDHLHFEVMVNGVNADPMEYLDIGK